MFPLKMYVQKGSEKSMRLWIDGNIVLDVFQKRDPHFADSSIVWKLCETKQVEGYLSALTFANLVYIMRKDLDLEKTNIVMEELAMIFHFTDLEVLDMKKAAMMQWDDFEDAVQAVTAQRIHADYIITRNTQDFENSYVQAVTPRYFLEHLAGSNLIGRVY